MNGIFLNRIFKEINHIIPFFPPFVRFYGASFISIGVQTIIINLINKTQILVFKF